MNIMIKDRRVVITGVGIVSSIGIGKDEFWKNLIAGKSGISRIASFDTKGFDRHFGGEVKNFKPEEFIDKRIVGRMGRASQLAVAAARLALEDAGLNIRALSRSRSGVCVGTTMGEAQILEKIDTIWTDKGDRHIDYKSILLYPSSIIPIHLAHLFELKSGISLFSNACSAGNYSIGHAYDLIKTGSADFMFAGGSDVFSRINLTGFSRLFAMAPRKCQPFDKNRKGMIVGEGSGILILEPLENAKKRKANIYAEVLGYGLSCDAYQMTASTVEGVSRCMKKAMREADIGPDDVDYISAHGTGTQHNDKTECSALREVFKSQIKKIAVSSIKSMLGHTMGAAAAIEAISCCLSIKNSIIPPTINYETPDPECDIDCVPNKAREKEVKIALNNSYAFGGNNACLVLKRY
jgi:3-oxoacyl-[acyl-carrier-protein] synthase II